MRTDNSGCCRRRFGGVATFGNIKATLPKKQQHLATLPQEAAT
ncbi:unnamed protein product [Caenorhabditis angaria]|uniref:Uncharacterized protein n=1 Tax=Caenorhabditis angaria TaxID=860376 RepID=A0A9P1IDT1_9PELO|nr:unnamed protein product [Caenorhabditis angaria]